MTAVQKLILKLMSNGTRWTSRQLANELSITREAVNANIKLLKEQGYHFVIVDFEQTGGRGRPVYRLSKRRKKNATEVRQPDSVYRQRRYQKLRALEIRRVSVFKYGKQPSPWDGFQDIQREKAA